jgi:putative transcriptional regulator
MSLSEYSPELCQQVIDLFHAGYTSIQICEMCNIDRDMLYRLMTRERSQRTRDSSKLSLFQNPLVRETLLTLLDENHSDWTLTHYCDALYERCKIGISISAMGVLLKKLGHRQKLGRPSHKTRYAISVDTQVDSRSSDHSERSISDDSSDPSKLGMPHFSQPKIDITALRQKLGLSQVEFARRFHLSLREVREWETGQQEPSGAASVLLFAIQNNPHAIESALRSCI